MRDAPAPHLLPWSDDLVHALELRVEEAQPVLLDLATQGVSFYVEEGRETVLASEYVDVWVHAEDVERAQELSDRREALTLGFDPDEPMPDDDAFDVPDLIDQVDARRASILRSLRAVRFGAIAFGLGALAWSEFSATLTERVLSRPTWIPGAVSLALAVVVSRFIPRFRPPGLARRS